VPTAMDRAELERRIRAVPIWYHTMELAPGIVTPGEFDMRPYVDDYHLPVAYADEASRTSARRTASSRSSSSDAAPIACSRSS
jgi:hypothetical protein